MIKTNPESIYPLSPMQEGMLHHGLHDEGAYIQQLVCSLKESLNVPLFVSAWQRVLERHSILQSSFHWEGLDVPLQEVHSGVQCPFLSEDYSALAPESRQEQLESYLRADRQRGFESTKAPLMRVAIFRMADFDYTAVWTFHHALLDGRSHFLVLKEVFDFYDAGCKGQKLELKQPRPFSEYVKWLSEQDLSKAEAFWRETLRGFTAPTVLRKTPDKSDSSEQGATHASEQLRISEELTSELRRLAKRSECTLNNVIQASWALLISRYTGEEDVVFGATRACRHWTDRDPQSMVGLFINTLPLRVSAQPERSLASWLRELRSQHIGLREYEHTPLAKIHEWSEVPRGTSLFETVLVFEDYQMNNRVRELGEQWRKRDFRLLEKANYPLLLAAYASSDIILKLEYDEQRFSRPTIKAMLNHFTTLLGTMTANPDRSIGELSMLPETERKQLLNEWNDTHADHGKDECIHHLFEAQVARTPDAVALIFGEHRLTYRELNRRANQLAHHLRTLGVGPEVLVGICIERSVEVIVGILGILKSGGAYVPLDPAYPRERLALMLDDSQATVLLTQQKLVDGLGEHRAQVVCLDSDWNRIAQESEEDPVSLTTPNNLAYVIYTSGSTGKPKGVAIEHRSTVALLHWATSVFTSEQLKGVLASTSVCFDLSVYEMFAPLSCGGAVILVENVLHLPTLPAANEVTLINTVPSAITELLRIEGMPASVRTVNLAGEPLKTSLVRQIYQLGTVQEVYDLYGPTEDTTYSTFTLRDTGPATIGRPISNTQAYILDRYLQPVPVGVPGELYLGGEGLARGYLNRPELTNDRFIRNPFSTESNARLYKTGDLTRYLPTGQIEFLGRIDHQVKIRGYRIELGEIETVLLAHATVSESVVIVREDIPGDNRLVAYIVPQAGEAFSTGELRTFLKVKLPDYMVPAAFVSLEKLPLTPNGKIDRKALPAPDISEKQEKGFVAPRSASEEMVAGIWSEVLGVRRIGVLDNFFELGGHSLKATQVMSRVRSMFEIELPLRTLFEAGNVAALAAILEDRLVSELEATSEDAAR